MVYSNALDLILAGLQVRYIYGCVLYAYILNIVQERLPFYAACRKKMSISTLPLAHGQGWDFMITFLSSCCS